MIDFLNDSEKWDRITEDSYFHHVGYRFGWLRAVDLSFPHLKPLPFAKLDSTGKDDYVCPCFHDIQKKQIISSPFFVPGFINKNINPDDIIRELKKYAKNERCRRILLQIPPGFRFANRLLSAGFVLEKKVSFFQIEIPENGSYEDYFHDSFKRTRKQDINQALRKGVKINLMPPSDEAVKRFYPFYQEFGQRKNIEVFDLSFIFHLSECLSENIQFWIAQVENQDIGSAITFSFKGRLWGWLLQGGIEFKAYKTDSLLYADIIRYGFERKMKIIDIGTTPLDSPLADFKLRFGAKPVFHELYKWDCSVTALIQSTFQGLKRLVMLQKKN
jgi:hypothetical protein